MSLKFAILAALQSQPQSGYEIARGFDRGIGYFWQATHQQIYRELGKMGEDLLVAFKEIPQTGRPAKKIYRLTPTGRKVLKKWLNEPAQETILKDELLVKLYAGDLGDPAALLEEVRRHHEQYVDRLAEYHAIEQRYFSDATALKRRHQFMYLTLRRGILTSQARIAWSSEVIAFLEAEHRRAA
ncbi:MAG: PadR family transcriptional regulator [Pseudomonadota bacterium]